MTALPTYALLAVVATWPAYALDFQAADRSGPAAPAGMAAELPAPAAPSIADIPIPAVSSPDQPPPTPPPAPPAPSAAPDPAEAPPAPPPPPLPPSARVQGTRGAASPQAAAPKVVAAPALAPTPPRAPGQLVNVAFEISLLERGESPTPPRLVTLRVADGRSAQVRQDLNSAAGLNIDIEPRIIDSGRVSVSLAVEFFQREKVEGTWTQRQMRTRVDVILKDGEATTVSQWSDPSVNQSMDIVVKATQVR